MTCVGIIVGLAICYVARYLVKYIIEKSVNDNIELIPPDGIEESAWKEVTGEENISEGGVWLGVFERILVFLPYGYQYIQGSRPSDAILMV
jgi:hypothetical protein